MSKFWCTQPIIENTNKEYFGQISVLKKDIKNTILPSNFYWMNLNVNDYETLKVIYNFLKMYYVEDKNNMYRLEYSMDFLKWILNAHGTHSELIVGLVYKNPEQNMLLVGFISGTIIDLVINGMKNKFMEINLLCVHKDMRSKGIAPLLIKEITRRSVIFGIQTAIYTIGKKVTKPFAITHYNNIFLNIEKLKQCKFINENYTKPLTLYHINNVKDTYIIRKIEERDIPQLKVLINKFMKKYKVHQHFNDKELRYLFCNDIISANVIEDKGIIIGMYSIYSLSSSILFKCEHERINKAYLYYYAYDNTKLNINDIMNYSIELSKEKHDILCYLNIMNNKYYLNTDVVNNCELNYNLFNYKLSQLKLVEPEEIGILIV